MTNLRCRVTTTALLAAIALPAHAAAQACMGVPIRGGQFAVEGRYSIVDGGKGFGAGLTANLAGPLSLHGGFTVTDVDNLDEDVTSFGVVGAYEVPNLSFSACPFVGVDYSSFSIEFLGFQFDASQTVVPIGVGIGRTFAAGSGLDFTLFATPHMMHVRTTLSGSDGTNEESESESSNEFGSHLGLRIGNGTLFGGAGVTFTTVEDTDPVFILSIGIALGTAR